MFESHSALRLWVHSFRTGKKGMSEEGLCTHRMEASSAQPNPQTLTNVCAREGETKTRQCIDSCRDKAT